MKIGGNMKKIAISGMFLISLILLILGCSMVEPRYQLPSHESGDPHALVNEEDLVANDIVSTIKGFCRNKSNCADTLEKPILDSSKGLLKAVYTFSPYGLITAPFADFKGRTIAVPVGEIGIVINHKYRKVLKTEKVLTVEKAGDKFNWSWNCQNGGSVTTAIGPSKKIRFVGSNISMLNEFSDGKSGNLYKITFEHCEWDTELWANIEEKNEYILRLSSNKLISPGGNVVGGKDSRNVQVPGTVTLSVDTEIISENRMFLGNKIGEEFTVDQNCMFSIINNGKFFVGIELTDSD